MTPADGLYGVQVLVSPLHCMHSLICVKAFSPPPPLPLSEEFGNVDKVGVSGIGTKAVEREGERGGGGGGERCVQGSGLKQ